METRFEFDDTFKIITIHTKQNTFRAALAEIEKKFYGEITSIERTRINGIDLIRLTIMGTKFTYNLRTGKDSPTVCTIYLREMSVSSAFFLCFEKEFVLGFDHYQICKDVLGA